MVEPDMQSCSMNQLILQIDASIKHRTTLLIKWKLIIDSLIMRMLGKEERRGIRSTN